MHLVNSLIAGVKGAENGTAQLFKRGTSTRATWYAEFEGTTANSTGADLSLDANGGVEVYVNELVDVVVKSSAGATVRSFTDGAASPNVEVRSASFTGTDYASGASATSSPTTAQAVLDLWYTNNTAADWKVKVGSTTATIPTHLGALAGSAIYNVKSPTYGAVGDGATDDTAAIQAAIDAASSGGGVVYFPQVASSYRVTSTLTADGDVMLVGAGAPLSVIAMDHASNDLLSFGGSGTGHNAMVGLRLQVLQAHSGNLLVVPAATTLVVERCQFGTGTNNNGDLVEIAASASTNVTFRDCRFLWTSATVGAINSLGAVERVRLEGCYFRPPATCNATNGIVYARQCDMDGCYFDLSVATAGTFSCYKASSTTLDAKIRGCLFEASGGATVTGMELGTYLAASRFYESDNAVLSDTSFTLYSYTVSAAQYATAAYPQIHLGTREKRTKYEDNSAATYTPATDQYGTIICTSSRAGVVSVVGVMAPPGATGVVWIANTNGVDRVYTPGGAFLQTNGKTISATTGVGMLNYRAVTDDAANANYLVNMGYNGTVAGWGV